MTRTSTKEEAAQAALAAYGIAPWTNQATDTATMQRRFEFSPSLRIYAVQYLSKIGLPDKSLTTANHASLAKAYTISAYAKAWRNRVNPNWSLLSGDDEDEAEADFSTTSEQRRPVQAPQGAPQGGQAASPAAAISAAATEDWLKTLYATIDRTTKALVDERFQSYEYQPTPAFKAQIAALAQSEAQKTLAAYHTPKRIEIYRPADNATVDLGLQHNKFETLLRLAALRLNIWVTGPAGAGKTTAAVNVAKALNLPFEGEGSLDADYKLMGHKDAMGQYVETAFFRRYTQGGVMLLDEVDSYSPSASLALNAALANGWCQFPHGRFDKHPDCIIIAGANTWGLGATNDYVGRNKMDAAFLDRFVKLPWPVDEDLEMAVATATGGPVGASWAYLVKNARRCAKAKGLKVVISPRATNQGIALLLADFTISEACEMTFLSGLSPEQSSELLRQIASQIDGLTRTIEHTKALAEQERQAELLEAEPAADDNDNDQDLSDYAREDQAERTLLDEIERRNADASAESFL